MKTKNGHYNYSIISTSEEGEICYQAVIPKFPGMFIFADTPGELPALVDECIEMSIEEIKRSGRPVPPPDTHTKFSGKFVVRIKPEMHQKLANLARACNTSLNKYIESTLEKFLSEGVELVTLTPKLQKKVDEIGRLLTKK